MSFGIIETGAVTSLGLDVSTTCAAIRAGISRPSPLKHFSVLDEDSQQLQGLPCHSVPLITEGFSTLPRWENMLNAAINDLIKRIDGRKIHIDWNKTGLILCLPNLDSARFMTAVECAQDEIEDSFFKPLISNLNISVNPKNCKVLSTGPCAPYSALEKLSNTQQLEWQSFIICSVDSYLDTFSIEWLGQNDRINLDGSVGLVPGEAATAILFDYNGQHQQYVVGNILNAAMTQDNWNIYDDIPFVTHNFNRELAKQLRANNLAPFSSKMWINLNGEEWRSRCLGTSFSSIESGTFSDPKMEIIITSVGDINVNHSLLALCCAIHNQERAPSENPNQLIMDIDELGQMGFMIFKGTTI